MLSLDTNYVETAMKRKLKRLKKGMLKMKTKSIFLTVGNKKR